MEWPFNRNPVPLALASAFVSAGLIFFAGCTGEVSNPTLSENVDAPEIALAAPSLAGGGTASETALRDRDRDRDRVRDPICDGTPDQIRDRQRIQDNEYAGGPRWDAMDPAEMSGPLAAYRDAIVRTVTLTETGAEIRIESDDPEVVALIQAYAVARHENLSTGPNGRGNPDAPRTNMLMDQIVMTVTPIENGVLITKTGTTPEAVEKIQEQAIRLAAVSAS